MGPRDLDTAKLLQMWREPLGVEQSEFTGAQMFDKCDERNLGCVRYPMKH